MLRSRTKIEAQIIAPLEALKELGDSDVAIETAALLEINTVAKMLEFLKQHEATPVLGWRRMGEAAAALIASVQLLSPSLLPPLTSHLLKELRENFNSGVTRLAVPTYYLTREDEEHEADEECDDKELDVELLHEREEVPTIKVSAIRPPGALRKNERALDRMMHALRRRGVRSTLQATQLCRGPRGWGPRAPAHLACPLRCAIHRPCLLRERESASQHRGCAPDSDEPRWFQPGL